MDRLTFEWSKSIMYQTISFAPNEKKIMMMMTE